MRCNKCGEKLGRNDSYCPICGARCEKTEKPIPQKTKVLMNFPASFDKVFLIVIISIAFDSALKVALLLGYFVSIGLGMVGFFFVLSASTVLLASMLDTLEFVDKDTIKIVRVLRRKTEIYKISSIAYVTDEQPGKTYRPESSYRPRYLVYSKEGMILFHMRNCYELYKLFDYYGIEMRIHHGV